MERPLETETIIPNNYQISRSLVPMAIFGSLVLAPSESHPFILQTGAILGGGLVGYLRTRRESCGGKLLGLSAGATCGYTLLNLVSGGESKLNDVLLAASSIYLIGTETIRRAADRVIGGISNFSQERKALASRRSLTLYIW